MDCRPSQASKPKGERKTCQTSSRRKAVMAKVKFTRVHWILIAFLVLAPRAGLAQQDNASQGQNQRDKDQPEAAQAKTEPAQTQTEDAESKTPEDGKLISV